MAAALLGSRGTLLPNELVLVVLDHLNDDYRTLCRLAQTCRSLQHLAEERIYRNIELTSIKALHAIVDAFAQRPARVRAMQTLKILYQYRDKDLKDSELKRMGFNSFLQSMVNLREWHIESPFDNFKWDRDGGDGWVEHDMQRFRSYLEIACSDGPAEAHRIVAAQRLGNTIERTVGLAQLQSLTIHSHGTHSDFWNLDGFHCLFRHPALRYLHVSCVVLPEAEIPELASHVKKSPLTTLIFDECELEPDCLLSILRTPAHLERLVLGENVFNIRNSKHIDPKLSKNAFRSLKALEAVSDSLESLTHLNPGWRNDFSPQTMRSIRNPGNGFRDFHKLKYMECDTNSFLHQSIIMNRDVAPPNLQTLRVRRHWDVGIDFWDQPPAMDHYAALPSLQTLELMQSTYIWHDLSHADYICESERLRTYHSIAYKLSNANINLRMLVELHKDVSLIPPYLHGELVPKILCVYDANIVGFRRHIDNNLWPGTDDFSSHDSPSAPFGPPREKPLLGNEPETDQLSDADVARIRGETRRALARLKHEFLSRRPRPAPLDLAPDTDDDDEEIEDLDEQEDLEMDDMYESEDEDDDDDFDMDDEDMQFLDEDGVHLFEHNGELYIEVYESVSESGSENESEGEGEGVGGGGGGGGAGGQGAGSTGTHDVIEDLD